jgi:biotin transport system substrate-specific component
MTETAVHVRSHGEFIRAHIMKPVAMTVGLVALIVASAYVSVPLPVGPVPMTMQSLAVLMAGIWAGPAVGTAAVATYLGLAVLGLPVLAGGAAAPGLILIAKPTFGFLVGFLVGAGVAGAVFRRMGGTALAALVALALGHAVIFAGGLAYLGALMPFAQAVAIGVLPFVAGTIVKMLLGTALVVAGRGLRKAH